MEEKRERTRREKEVNQLSCPPKPQQLGHDIMGPRWLASMPLCIRYPELVVGRLVGW